VAAELRPSVFSVVRAAYFRFTTEGTEDTEGSRTGGSRVRVG